MNFVSTDDGRLGDATGCGEGRPGSLPTNTARDFPSRKSGTSKMSKMKERESKSSGGTTLRSTAKDGGRARSKQSSSRTVRFDIAESPEKQDVKQRHSPGSSSNSFDDWKTNFEKGMKSGSNTKDEEIDEADFTALMKQCEVEGEATPGALETMSDEGSTSSSGSLARLLTKLGNNDSDDDSSLDESFRSIRSLLRNLEDSPDYASDDEILHIDTVRKKNQTKKKGPTEPKKNGPSEPKKKGAPEPKKKSHLDETIYESYNDPEFDEDEEEVLARNRSNWEFKEESDAEKVRKGVSLKALSWLFSDDIVALKKKRVRERILNEFDEESEETSTDEDEHKYAHEHEEEESDLDSYSDEEPSVRTYGTRRSRRVVAAACPGRLKSINERIMKQNDKKSLIKSAIAKAAIRKQLADSNEEKVTALEKLRRQRMEEATKQHRKNMKKLGNMLGGRAIRKMSRDSSEVIDKMGRSIADVLPNLLGNHLDTTTQKAVKIESRRMFKEIMETPTSIFTDPE